MPPEALMPPLFAGAGGLISAAAPPATRQSENNVIARSPAFFGRAPERSRATRTSGTKQSAATRQPGQLTCTLQGREAAASQGFWGAKALSVHSFAKMQTWFATFGNLSLKLQIDYSRYQTQQCACQPSTPP